MRVEQSAALVAAINTRAINLFLRKGRSMEVLESGRERRGASTVAERLESLSSLGVCYVFKKGYRNRQVAFP